MEKRGRALDASDTHSFKFSSFQFGNLSRRKRTLHSNKKSPLRDLGENFTLRSARSSPSSPPSLVISLAFREFEVLNLSFSSSSL